jgi:L-rhamnose mutarotase
MERVAFKMHLKPGFEEEYKRRHDALWPEMAAALKEAGIYDYSIFLDPETLTLFGVQKLVAGATSEKLPGKAVVRRWWDYMKDIMDTNPDGSPESKDLVEVFHLD